MCENKDDDDDDEMAERGGDIPHLLCTRSLLGSKERIKFTRTE